jgi:hypothetical protein
LHRQILSVLMQKLDANMLPLEHDRAGSFGSGLFVHASVVVDKDEAGYKLVYRIAEVCEIFKLYRVRALAFPMQRSLLGAMNLGSNSVAVNNRGYSFLYKPEDCEWTSGSAICHADRVEVHSKPQTCVEELIV